MNGQPKDFQPRPAFFAGDDMTTYQSDHPPYDSLTADDVEKVIIDPTEFHEELAAFLLEATD